MTVVAETLADVHASAGALADAAARATRADLRLATALLDAEQARLEAIDLRLVNAGRVLAEPCRGD